MIKRPLCTMFFGFAVMLWMAQLLFPHLFHRSFVETDEEGETSLYGYTMWDDITVTGTVASCTQKVNQNQKSTLIVLKKAYLRNAESNPVTHSGQQIQCYINEYQTIEIGKKVCVRGKLVFPATATNPGEFDAAKFYKNRDIIFFINQATIIGEGKKYDRVKEGLQRIRKHYEKKLEEYLPEGETAVIKAMLFGNKTELDEDLKDLYQKNGIAHILAISGLHISMLGMALFKLLEKLPVSLRVRCMISGAVIFCYGIMVGFSASSCRAICMYCLFLLAKITKRTYDMLTAVSVAGVLLLLQHPGYIFDCGFLLSFSAVLAMAVLLPIVEYLLAFLPGVIRKTICPTFCVFFMTAPILAYFYHEISLFSILLNMIVIPFVSLLLMMAVGLVVFADLIPAVAFLFAIPVRIILGIYQGACLILEHIGIGRWNIETPAVWKLVVYYGVVLVLTITVKRRKERFFPQGLGLMIAMVMLLMWRTNPGICAWMLDVGQGDCSVIFNGKKETYMIDAGSSSKKNVGEKIVIPFLKSKGVNRVKAVFLSHPDEDHMNGIAELFEQAQKENIVIENLVISASAMKHEYEKLKGLLETAKKEDIPVVTMQKGDSLISEHLVIRALYPAPNTTETGNNASLVLLLETSSTKSLYMGDLEAAGEEDILREYKNEISNITNLKVGHHGSSTSSGEAFLKRIHSKKAFISCGKNNKYGHPHKEVMENLAHFDNEIFVTTKCGAIYINLEKK